MQGFVAWVINESSNTGVSTAGEVFTDRQGGFVIELILVAPLTPSIFLAFEMVHKGQPENRPSRKFLASALPAAAPQPVVKGRKYSYEGEGRIACAVSAESLSLDLHIEG